MANHIFEMTYEGVLEVKEFIPVIQFLIVTFLDTQKFDMAAMKTIPVKLYGYM